MISPELAILHHLAACTHSSAAEIGAACAMTTTGIEAQLVMLDLRGLVLGRQDAAVPPRRVYRLTAEGRRKAGIGDARRG